MKLPRDISGADLIRRLEKRGYTVTRLIGSHVRLTKVGDPAHNITVPAHDPLRVGTLSSILADVAKYEGVSKETLIKQLFG
ncbi:MAG: type II toxin-antitoxin system HicA family toxin [Candidatus Competibacteraceae bacterium]|jgi:predicted RNA binding protein YcfA (HicA-like mRNA interferase family)|nr:type II toxin-antitoxin system HicA family toxin [Candidatus Competibacteraceae bacterium]